MASRARAYREQAESDLAVFNLLWRAGSVAEECHALHYLQMASEKAAKAVLATAGVRFGNQHHSLSFLLGMWKHQRMLPVTRHLGSPPLQVRAMLKAVEALCPQIANSRGVGLNAEYPWEDPAAPGAWYSPCKQRFRIVLDANARLTLLELIRFLETALRRVR
jgi:hypothetical protein